MSRKLPLQCFRMNCEQSCNIVQATGSRTQVSTDQPLSLRYDIATGRAAVQRLYVLYENIEQYIVACWHRPLEIFDAQ
jgi:hypothetical protein